MHLFILTSKSEQEDGVHASERVSKGWSERGEEDLVQALPLTRVGNNESQSVTKKRV